MTSDSIDLAFLMWICSVSLPVYDKIISNNELKQLLLISECVYLTSVFFVSGAIVG